jgi:hypothetical protein
MASLSPIIGGVLGACAVGKALCVCAVDEVLCVCVLCVCVLCVCAVAKVENPDVSPIAVAVMTVTESHPDMSRWLFMVSSSWNYWLY